MEVHPYFLRNKEASTAILTQRSPYITGEQHKYSEEYTTFCNVMEEVFMWIAEKVGLCFLFSNFIDFNFL